MAEGLLDWQALMGQPLAAEEAAAFQAYYEALVEGNRRMNLTAITAPEEAALLHFADALSAEGYIPQGASVIDVGSGAGIPGIPLAIRRRDASFLLLDSLQKRVGFLNETVQLLGLTQVRAEHGRAEDAIKDRREAFDVGVARAVAPLNVLCELVLPFVKVGGRMIAYKGPQAEEEAQRAKRALQILGGSLESIEDVSLAGRDHKLILVKKVAKTPAAYPRRAGTPGKSPL